MMWARGALRGSVVLTTAAAGRNMRCRPRCCCAQLQRPKLQVRSPLPRHLQQQPRRRLFDLAKAAATAPSQAEAEQAQRVQHADDMLYNRNFYSGAFPAEEFRERQRRLAERLGPNSVAILVGATTVFRAADIPHKFKQSAPFLYLSAFVEENAVLILQTDHTATPHTILAVQPSDPTQEMWHGARVGFEMASELYPVDECIAVTQLATVLHPLLQAADNVYCDLAVDGTPIPTHSEGVGAGAGSRHLATLGHLLTETRQMPALLSPHLDALRVIKSDAELDLLRSVSDISARTFVEVIQASGTTLHSELAIESAMEHGFRKRGAHGTAYPPVVAGGPRGNTLHYLANNRPLDPSHTVLVDAGAEKHGYCSDITRTWPMSGTFSPAARAVYEAVLRIQTDLIQHAVVDGFVEGR